MRACQTTPVYPSAGRLSAAYPFGPRAYSPYKQWLKARREYLCRYGHQPRNAPPESPMERMMRRAREAAL